MIFATQAMVEFVGIVMLTTGGGSGVVAIMPTMPSAVETHIAVVAFRSQALDRQSLKGWGVTDLPSFSYVQLAPKDQVHFITHAQNNAAGAPTHLRHLKPDWVTNNGGDYQLDTGYMPPYSHAAAVVTLTEGSVDGCQSQTHPGRMDTVATFNTSGVLTVSNDDNSKHFDLNVTPNEVIVVAHVPSSYLTTGAAGGNHYLAYCSMAKTPPEFCPVPQAVNALPCPVSGYNMPILRRPTSSGGRDEKTEKMMTPTKSKQPAAQGRVAPKADATHDVHKATARESQPNGYVASADCSNTAWP
jgi:hypothetical protein